MSENEPVVFWPKCSSSTFSARSVSVPGSENRFVSRSLKPDIAPTDPTRITAQTATTAHRSRIMR